MASLPAFCTSCGGVFVTSLFGGSAKGITFENSVVGPCPRCGGYGRIIDGVYDLVDNAFRIVRTLGSEGVTATELQQLIDLFEHALRAGLAPEDVLVQVRRQIPRAEPIVGLANETARRGGTNWGTWVMILIALLQLLVGWQAWRQPRDASQEDTHRLIESICQILDELPDYGPPPRSR